jgi:leader peptidase (prepilin peptidase)/N-methyltransferase
MESFYLFAVFVFGLAIGSFMNVVIYRLPRGENLAFPPSHCTGCGESLKWYHNIPLFSWLMLRGRCAFCKSTISPRYPLIELLNALLWSVIYIKVGAGAEFLFIALSFSALLVLSAIDFEYYAVPDSVNFFALASALAALGAKAYESGEWEILLSGAQAAAIAAGGLWLLAKSIGIITQKEAMGGADVIVAATMAALLGLSHFLVAIFLSAILAIVPSIAAKDTMVPFVPFLALATFITYIYDDRAQTLLNWIMYG